MSRCDVVGEKPKVWKDDFGWNCDQGTYCRKCCAVGFDRITEDTTWSEAMEASKDARPVVPQTPHTAPLTPEQSPADQGDGSGAGGRSGGERA